MYPIADVAYAARNRAGCLLIALFGAGCSALGPSQPAESEVLAGPLPGLSGPQLALHIRGDEEFGRVFGVADGLGPVFVAESCERCHVGDGKGHPVFNLTRFGRLTASGFDPMPEFGGPQIQNRAIPTHIGETIPAEATGHSVFTAPAVTGLGLLEAVPDETLLALEDPDDLNGDGISGRVQLVREEGVVVAALELEQVLDGTRPRVRVGGRLIGRFGKKASAISLLHQTANAYREDMGITSDLNPVDPVNLRSGGFGSDGVPDPEVTSDALAAVVFYLRTLRAPVRRSEGATEVQAGERLFGEVGCAACHLPNLTTGPSPLPGLDRITFHPFTDLLLHDMGSGLDDGYTEGRALGSEWRTPPLWGIGLAAESQGGTGFFLHDGRARTLSEAIALHGGEGAASRAKFEGLSPEDQNRLLMFLRSL